MAIAATEIESLFLGVWVQICRESRDKVEHNLSNSVGVLLKYFKHAVCVHSFGVRDETRIKVSDERNVHDGHAHLAAEIRLGILGHVNDLPAGIGEPFALGLCAKPWPVADNYGAAVVALDSMASNGFDRDPSKLRMIGFCRRHVAHDRPFEEGVLSAIRSIYKLITHHEIARLDMGLQRSGGARGDHRFHAELMKSPNVCPVVHHVRRNGVAAAMSWQEGDLSTADFGQKHRITRRSVGSVNLDLFDIVEEAVESRASKNSDLGDRFITHVYFDAVVREED